MARSTVDYLANTVILQLGQNRISLRNVPPGIEVAMYRKKAGRRTLRIKEASFVRGAVPVGQILSVNVLWP